MKTKAFFVLVMLALLGSLVIPFATPALAQQGEAASPPGANADGLNMSLAVIPTVTLNGSTVGYYITISNNPGILPLISADAQNIVVTFSPPDVTGAPGAPVTIATIPSLAVGGSVSYNPGNTPALSVVLALNPGVAVAWGESHLTATLLTDPPSTASDTKDIPTNIIIPAIAVTKSANPTSFSTPGTVTYSYTVTNTGNTNLNPVTLNDDKAGAVTLLASSLAAGASTTGTATFAITQAMIDAGTPIVNVATATGHPPVGNDVTAQANATVTIVQQPAIAVTKSANPTSFSTPGTVTYSYTVTNTGNVTLNPVTLNDNKAGAVTLLASSLAPGASTTGTKTFAITQAMIDAGTPIVNVATATGHPPVGPDVTGNATATVTIVKLSFGCTLTWGYWKTHSYHGPAAHPDETWNLIEPNGVDSPFFISGQSYYQVLQTEPKGGNAYYILAHQYIAAELNMLNGASSTAEVDAAMAWAENFFNTYEPSDTFSKALRASIVNNAGTLGSYNEGLIGPGHCSE